MNTNMQTVIRHILYLNGLAEAFDTAEDFHLRLKNDPWLALVVERHGDEVSVTHYIEQNGDFLRDPEMILSIHQWATLSGGLFKNWVPMSTEPGGFGRIYQTGEVQYLGDEPPKLLYYPKRMKEAIHFATLWAKNLRAQGFVKRYGVTDIESLTHPEQLALTLATAAVPIPIRHTVTQCLDGTEFHAYEFPEDLPSRLMKAAYTQAEAKLKTDWPSAGDTYGYGVSSRGYSLHTAPLPPCTCHPSTSPAPTSPTE